jgi:hypothetical protein
MEQTFIILAPNKEENKKYFTTLDDAVRIVFECIDNKYKEINGNKIIDVISDLKTLFDSNRKRWEGYKFKYGILSDNENKTFCVFTEAIKL